MAAPLTTNVNVKQEEPDPDTGLCLICTLPIQTPGGEPDALLCGQCGVVYHRECAPEWTSECYQCHGKKTLSSVARPLPPGPVVGGVELDGDEEEEEEEGEAARKKKKNAAYVRESRARLPVQRCDSDGCEFETNRMDHLGRHQARVHGLLLRDQLKRCDSDGCEFQTKNKSHLRVHQACVHGIGDMNAEEHRRKSREYKARQPLKTCGVDGCEYQTKLPQNFKRHQVRVHGIGNADAEALRKKLGEWQGQQVEAAEERKLEGGQLSRASAADQNAQLEIALDAYLRQARRAAKGV
jgi:hypothetical protein